MQLVSWVSGDEWTDEPACTLPALRNIAIQVNDSLGDSARQQLLPLIPRLINTAVETSDERLRRNRWVNEWWTTHRSPIGVAQSLAGLLDAYEAEFGRPEPVEQPDYSKLCALQTA